MKIGIFTDPHYSSAEVTCGNRYNSKSLKKIDEALGYFTEEKCDLVICLGDLIDKEEVHNEEIANLKKVSDVFSKYKIKIYAVLGNHDGFAFDEDEFYKVLGEQYRPENIYCESGNLIFIDACYYKSGVHYRRGFSDWTDTFYPKTDELRTILAEADGDSYIFMHQNIDPNIRGDHRLSNDAEVREILEKSGKVKAVFQGHYHLGCESEINGIRYVTYPAMCVAEQRYFVVEI